MAKRLLLDFRCHPVLVNLARELKKKILCNLPVNLSLYFRSENLSTNSQLITGLYGSCYISEVSFGVLKSFGAANK